MNILRCSGRTARTCFLIVFSCLLLFSSGRIIVAKAEISPIVEQEETAVRVMDFPSAGFHVSGRYLLDANNNAFIMRGINHPHTWYAAQTSSFPNIKNTRANTIRVVLSSGRWGTVNSATDVANVIQLCKDNKLICVLENHDTTGYGEATAGPGDNGPISLAEAVSYWQGIQSVLTGQEAYVIINIGNEPYGNTNASDWIEATRNAIIAMRNAGFDHTLMVDAPNWGQDWQFFMRDNAASLFDSDVNHNTIFSIHMYGVFDGATPVQNYVSAFVSAGLPLVIGEFGWEHSDGDPDEISIMSAAQANGIGYLGWSWSGNSGEVGYLDMVLSFDPTRLTWWGDKIIKTRNGIRETSCEASVYNSAPNPQNCSIAVSIGTYGMGLYPLASGESQRYSYTGQNLGPVTISNMDGTPIIASQRINLLNHPAVSSYTEFMGLPATQVTDKYLFPWYNNVSLDSQLRIANLGTNPATVNIKIGTLIDEDIPLGINESVRLKYDNVDTGPVVIASTGDVPIIVSERINLLNHPSVSSYTELIGLPGSDTAGTRYLFPWYNNVSLDSQLRFANMGSAPTTVTVKIGDQVNQTFLLDINQSRRETFPGVDTGPVEVTSSGSVPIIASERVNLLNHPAVSNYSELIGQPGATATHTKYVFPWYNNVSLDSQLRVANIGSGPAVVNVKIGTQVNQTVLFRGPDQAILLKFQNVDTGPVVIESLGGEPIVVSERVNLLNHPAVSSYTEFIGLSVGDPLGWPGNQLGSTYWFPWYNNVSLDSQLRLGIP